LRSPGCRRAGPDLKIEENNRELTSQTAQDLGKTATVVTAEPATTDKEKEPESSSRQRQDGGRCVKCSIDPRNKLKSRANRLQARRLFHRRSRRHHGRFLESGRRMRGTPVSNKSSTPVSQAYVSALAPSFAPLLNDPSLEPLKNYLEDFVQKEKILGVAIEDGEGRPVIASHNVPVKLRESPSFVSDARLDAVKWNLGRKQYIDLKRTVGVCRFGAAPDGWRASYTLKLFLWTRGLFWTAPVMSGSIISCAY